MWIIINRPGERREGYIDVRQTLYLGSCDLLELKQEIRCGLEYTDWEGDSVGGYEYHQFSIILKNGKDEFVLFNALEKNIEYCGWQPGVPRHPKMHDKKFVKSEFERFELLWMKRLCKIERWIMEAVSLGEDIVTIDSNEIIKQLDNVESNPILKAIK